MGTIIEDAVFTVQGKELMVNAVSVVWFYESGNLKYTTAIPEPTVFQVQGKEVLFTAQYDVYVPMGFHENGHILRGSLAEETAFEVQGKTVKVKGMVNFSDTDQLLYGWLTEDTTIMIQGKPMVILADKTISFYENGVVKECGFFKKDTAFQVQDKMVLFTSYRTSSPGMTFFNNGNIIYGSLAEDTAFTIQGNEVWLEGRSVVSFHKNGALSGGKLVKNTVLDVQDKKIVFKAGRGLSIRFYESGVLQSGFLAESAELIYQDRPITIPEGNNVEFDEQGTLISFSTDVY